MQYFFPAWADPGQNNAVGVLFHVYVHKNKKLVRKQRGGGKSHPVRSITSTCSGIFAKNNTSAEKSEMSDVELARRETKLIIDNCNQIQRFYKCN